MKKLFLKVTAPMLVAGSVMVLGGLLFTGCKNPGDNRIIFTPVEGEAELTGSPAPAAAGTPSARTSTEAARLEKDDLVRVTFSGITEPIQPHEERVKEDGTITLPLIGAVKAQGRTLGELQKAITEKYVPDYYKRLTITVSTDRRVYYVQGQVRQSGRQEYIGHTTVLKAITSAGDFTDFANRKKVILTRADGTRHMVDCIKAAQDSSYDLPVFPGDKIEVKMRWLFQ